MPDLEAVGDAVTGGAIAGAVEPKTGPGGHTHETHCLNCGAELLGPYCSQCGQHAHVHRTLTAFSHDLLHGVLHFEGKIWRTLPLLAWKPGELTRRYIDGERARFLSPIALFLFSVFLMFAVVSLTGSTFGQGPAAARQGLEQELRQDARKLQEMEAVRSQFVKTGQSTAEIDEKISELRAEMTAVEVIKDQKIPTQPLTFDSDGAPGWLRGALAKAKDNPELLLYKIKTNAYKFSWALIPISVPFVWLLFPFSRRFRMYDHTVFVTYSLCFMTLLLIAGSTLELVAPAIAGLLFLVPPFHMYRQLKGTYGLSRFGALWRTIALTVFAFIAIGLFTSLLVGLGSFA
jgi:hypothetical protein